MSAHTHGALGELTTEERHALDIAVAAILAGKSGMGAGNWASDAAEAADRALAWVELRRRLIPRGTQPA